MTCSAAAAEKARERKRIKQERDAKLNRLTPAQQAEIDTIFRRCHGEQHCSRRHDGDRYASRRPTSRCAADGVKASPPPVKKQGLSPAKGEARFFFCGREWSNGRSFCSL
jgi:hypothetical protein